MLFKKTGMPEEGECVFCTVTKVQYHSVFANLDEYERKHGMIHISEISPGRIRNINEYVKEGKVIICKVLRINRERGHIDLSLRRVTEAQRRAKVEERKQQIIAENIVQSYSQLNKLDVKKTYTEVANILLKSYDTLYDAFEDVVENEANLVDVGLPKNIAKALDPLIHERIKPKQVEIVSTLTITSFASNGVEIINALMKKLVLVSDLLKIQFLGSGKFKLEIVAPDYQEAEAVFAKAETLIKEGTADAQTNYNLARV